MNNASKKALSVLLLIAVVGTGLFMFSNYFVGGKPPTPPPIDVDTDNDGVTDTRISFSMFQALRIIYTDGSDTWKYPQSRTTLVPFTIIDSGISKVVGSIQAYIFFNLASSKQVNQVIFACSAKYDIYDEQNQLYKSLGAMPVAETVANPQNATDVYVGSATLSASDFQALIIPGSLQFDYTMYYVITCSGINADVQFSGGTSKTFGLTGVQTAENQLHWKFRLIQSGNIMQITSIETEWMWK